MEKRTQFSIWYLIVALGYTIQRPTEDRFLMTREELENKMAVLLGGRAAEQLIYSEETAREIDCAVREIISGVFDKAVAILTRNRAVLEEGARRLLEKETLGEAELAHLRRELG